jgi:hypothetical protein
VEQLEHRWCPSYSLITSRSALAGTDSVDWATLGPPGTTTANPFTILSAGGDSITVSKAITDGFQTYEQAPPTTPTVYSRYFNFAPGDIVLITTDVGSKVNPVTLNFGSTPVAAGGAQIATTNGAFTAEVEAFDARGKSLASFTENGNSAGTADNSAIFLGLSSTSANIYEIALSITKVTVIGGFNARESVYINKFDFRTSPLAAVTSAAAPAAGRHMSALDLAPLASSLSGTGQDALPVVPPPGPATPSAPPASQSGLQRVSGPSSATHAGATDVIFAASRTTVSEEDALLFAPWSSGSFDSL